MKNGGTILLLCLTVAFAGFIAGMLAGRSITQEPAIVQFSAEEATQHSQPESEQTSVSSQELININTASAKILDTLPGIGPVIAQRIVEYRQNNGPFEQISDLSKVDGIGSEKLLAVLDFITVEE